MDKSEIKPQISMHESNFLCQILYDNNKKPQTHKPSLASLATLILNQTSKRNLTQHGLKTSTLNKYYFLLFNKLMLSSLLEK